MGSKQKCVYLLVYDPAQVGHAEPGVADDRGIDVDPDLRCLPGEQVFLKAGWDVKNKYIFGPVQYLVDVVVYDGLGFLEKGLLNRVDYPFRQRGLVFIDVCYG